MNSTITVVYDKLHNTIVELKHIPDIETLYITSQDITRVVTNIDQETFFYKLGQLPTAVILGEL